MHMFHILPSQDELFASLKCMKCKSTRDGQKIQMKCTDDISKKSSEIMPQIL